MRTALTVLLMLMLHISHSQSNLYRFADDVGLQIDAENLADPFAGGLNAIQANTMDVDGDGTSELVIYERFLRRVMVFRKSVGKWLHQPFLADHFPEEVSDWMLLRDFNADGKPDLFTGDPLGIRVFVNVSVPGKPAQWRTYHPGFPLLTKGFTANINLMVNADDVPSIDDIDGDGDLDILVTRFVGNSTIEFHRNLSIERSGNADSLQMERVTQTWGNIEECSCGKFSFGDPCPPDAERTLHTGGKSLLTIDVDGDGDKDLLFGEEECNFTFLLENKGTAQSESFNDFRPYPVEDPSAGQSFPSTFLADIDGDLRNDLVFSSNLPHRMMAMDAFAANLLWFRNTALTGPPDFSKTSEILLQDQMVDVGERAAPAVVDLDADGDEDLLIGSWNEGLWHFENTGSPGAPAFILRNRDFLGIANSGLFNIRPQFTDLTGDGRPDLVFTATSMDTGSTDAWLIPNRSEFSFEASVSEISRIPFAVWSKDNIRFRDISQDGKPDILRFNSSGGLEYHLNTGGNNFLLQTQQFAGLASDPARAFAPFTITDLDADGKEDLLYPESGVMKIVGDFRGPDPARSDLEVVESLSEQSWTFKTLGSEFPLAVNWFNQRIPSILTGTLSGGIRLLRPSDEGLLPDQPQVRIYPNPLASDETLRLVADRPGNVTLYNPLGQRLSAGQAVEAHVGTILVTPDLAAGLYLLRFESGSGNTTLRLIRH